MSYLEQLFSEVLLNTTSVTFKKFLFIFGCAGCSLLCRAFSSCGEGGYSLVAVCRLLTAVASLVLEHGL